MSVERLKRDFLSAAQEYKRKYKLEGENPEDLDKFKRLMDIYFHLDDINGGGGGETVRTVDSYNATEGQSTFAITAAEFDFLDVYLNGARLISSEYAVSGSDIILSSAAELDDEVIIISYDNSSVIDINSLLDNVGSVGNDLYLFYNY